MTYREFNERIFNFYAARSSSAFANFSFETFDIESILPVEELKRFEILRKDWSYLLRTVENIPQYFGLLAIQCCAASMMETSDNVTLNAYQLRLVRLLGIKDEAALQQLFKEESSGRPVQEVLWLKARQFLRDHLNQELTIPPATSNAGRYVQYPKFQALFNTEELKYFTIFFSETFQVRENLTWTFFETKFRSSIKNVYLSPRMQNLLEDPQKGDRAIRQLFNYYNHWQGEVYDTRRRKGNNTTAILRSEGQPSRLFLIVERDTPEFYLSPQQERIELHSCLSLTGYHYFNRSVQLFSEIPGFFGEYEHSRFIYLGIPCCLLLVKSLNNRLLAYLEKSSNARRLIDDSGLVVYYYLPSEDTLLSPLQAYIQSEKPFTLKGGLRFKHKEYLMGFGPAIYGSRHYAVLFQHMPIVYDPQLAGPGEYIIRTSEYKDLRFYIIAPSQSVEIISAKGTGWILKKLAIGSTPDVEGCLFGDLKEKKVAVIRSWIDANLNNKQNKLHRPVHPILMALNYNKL